MPWMSCLATDVRYPQWLPAVIRHQPFRRDTLWRFKEKLWKTNKGFNLKPLISIEHILRKLYTHFCHFSQFSNFSRKNHGHVPYGIGYSMILMGPIIQMVHSKWSCHSIQDDIIKWKHFPCYWPFVQGIHRSPVNSPHKGQWCGALIFSLICTVNKQLSKQSWGWSWWRHQMKTFFRVTGPLCREFTGHRWFPLTKASDAELWCFVWSAP